MEARVMTECELSAASRHSIISHSLPCCPSLPPTVPGVRALLLQAVPAEHVDVRRPCRRARGRCAAVRLLLRGRDPGTGTRHGIPAGKLAWTPLSELRNSSGADGPRLAVSST